MRDVPHFFCVIEKERTEHAFHPLLFLFVVCNLAYFVMLTNSTVNMSVEYGGMPWLPRSPYASS